MNEQTILLISLLLRMIGWIAPVFVMALLLFRINVRYGVGIGNARILSGGILILVTLLITVMWQYHFGKLEGAFQYSSHFILFVGIVLSLNGAIQIMKSVVLRNTSLTFREDRKKLQLLLVLGSGGIVCASVLYSVLLNFPVESIIDSTLYTLNISLLAYLYFAMGYLVFSQMRATMRAAAWGFMVAGCIVLLDGIVRMSQMTDAVSPLSYSLSRYIVSFVMAAAGCITIVLGMTGAAGIAPLLTSETASDSLVHYKLNVQKRFLLLLVISVIVIGATGFVILDVIESGRRSIQQTFFNEQRKVAESVSANMEGLNQSFLSTLRELSQDAAVQDVRVDSMRDKFKKTFQVWKNIAYSITRTDERGILRYTYPEIPGAAGTDISKQPHVQRLLATRDTIFTGIFTSVQGHRSFAMYVPVYAQRPDGRGVYFAGGIAMLLHIDAYAVRAFRNTKIFTPNPLAAISTAGRVIVASENRYAGEESREYLRSLFPTLANEDSLQSVANSVASFSLPQFVKIVDNTADSASQWLIAHPLRFANKPWGVIILPVSNTQIYSVYSQTIDRQMFLWAGFAIVLVGLMGAVVIIFYRWSRFLEQEVQREFTIVREAEGKYAKLFNEAIVGIFQTAPDGGLISANPSLAKMLGYGTIAEFLASDVLRTPAGIDQAVTPWEEILRHRESSCTVALRKADGSTIHALVLCKAIVTADNRIQQYEGFVEDVTDRKTIEDALRNSEAELRALFAAMNDVIIVIDAHGRYLKIAPTNPKLLYRSPAELMGKLLGDIFPPEQADEFLRYIGQSLALRTNVRFEYELDIEGQKVSFGAVISPMSDDTVMWIARDIGERKRLEQQLLQAQKLEGIGTLAGGIAHDFNNLLAMILGSGELLRVHAAEYPKLKKYVDRIIEASERGASISRQLLIFSRPDQAELKQIPLSGIIAELAELLKHFLPKSVSIETHLDADCDIIMGDAGHLHQALLNLALNANDAMPEGGSLVISEFSAPYELVHKKIPQCEPGMYAAVSISDTGIGIDEALKAKIFDPFFSTKERGKGTGLGLSIVHGIVKSHQGYISVESMTLKGTIFTLYFPVVTASSPAAADPVPKTARNGNHATILIVDDEELIREMLKEYLEGSGYTVLTAVDGRDALRVYTTRQASIDMVITDLGMPEMGGEELYTRLRCISPSVNVMVSSGYLDNSTKEKLISMGIKDVLTKPYRLDNIQTAIDAIME